MSADELHKLVGVPRDYLSKILGKLTAAGLLNSEKGHGGGFKLSSPPSTITFRRILDAVGFSFDPDHCAFGYGSCNSQNPCPLHEAFSKLNNQFIEWATTTTLADVNKTASGLARLKGAQTIPTTDSRLRKKRTN